MDTMEVNNGPDRGTIGTFYAAMLRLVACAALLAVAAGGPVLRSAKNAQSIQDNVCNLNWNYCPRDP